MPVYAIGDIQGCYDELLTLLDRVRFDATRDRLWLTGDLVNRGPRSLEVLRFVKGLGDRAVTVLGNHDLHLLAVATTEHGMRCKDTLQPVLLAPDRDELLTWLRHRPLLHHDATLGYTLVHAGLAPQWDLGLACRCARELEGQLRGPDHVEYFAHMYGNTPELWSDELTEWDRLRFITNCFTRMRYCREDGALAFDTKAAPGTQPLGYVPWFASPHRASAAERIVVGHWSTVELNHRVDPKHRVVLLDHGCVWGGHMTAFELEQGRYLDMPCRGWQQPTEPREHKVALRSWEITLPNSRLNV